MDERTSEMILLLGTDFSESSELALEQAVRIAVTISARLDVAHICHPSAFATEGETAYVVRAGERLEAIRERVAEKVPCEAYLRSGDAVSGLLSIIQDLRPALLIVGSHGRSAMLRALLGSVTARLCHQSPVPVLVVPAPGLTAPVADTGDDPDVPETSSALAWICARCGHIRGTLESERICSRCGARPAIWDVAPMSAGPADAQERAVGESVSQGRTGWSQTETMELFPTSPPGTEGSDVNPELRVRY